MPKVTFSDEELKSPLFFNVTKYPDGPKRGFTEFSGFITDDALIELRLDHIDRQVVGSPMRDTADILQSLEIIFRRWAQQHRPSPLAEDHPAFDTSYRNTTCPATGRPCTRGCFDHVGQTSSVRGNS